MVEEEYVSFEIAKLLKEKGFDKEFDADIVRYYNEDGRLENVDYEQTFRCPSLAMVTKWLRDEHGIFIYIKPWLRYWGSECAMYKEHRFVLEGYVPHVLSIDNPKEYKPVDKYCVPTYEKAWEAAIKYCLDKLGKKEI